MKNTAKALLLLIVAMALVFCFTACGGDDGGEDHTHTAVKVAAKAPTCTTDGNSEYWSCSGCGKLFKDADCKTETKKADHTLAALGHTPKEDDGDCTTAICCSVCDTVITEAKAAHTPKEDDGDCTTAIRCSVCDTVTTEAKAAHTPKEDDGDCSTDITCTDCGHVFVVGRDHNFDNAWNATDSSHWYECLNDGCNARDSFGEHFPEEDDGDCTTAVFCDECGWTLVPASEGHTPKEDDGDCTTAIRCSVCDTVTTEAKAAHTPEEDDGDCTTAIECSECDSVAVAGKSHEDENNDGACDHCRYEFDYRYDEASNTYYIFTAAGLYAWGNYSRDVNVLLMKNIDMPEELAYDLDGNGENDSNWDPLPFSKTFDGNGYSISGIKLSASENGGIGFFSDLLEGATVKDLFLVDISVNGGVRIAGLAANNRGTIINCSVSGSIYSSENDAAGIVGYNGGDIIACHNLADVYTEVGGSGGIVAQSDSNGDGNVIGCYNTGRITSSGDDNGGIIGSGYAGKVLACFNAGEITAVYGNGALVGYDDSDCYLTACYFISESEELNGTGNGSGDSAFRIDGTALTLSDAIAAMNEALAENGYLWEYVPNEGADADVSPVAIVAIEHTMRT